MHPVLVMMFMRLVLKDEICRKCVVRDMTLPARDVFDCQYIDGLVQDCGNSIANALELLKFYSKLLMWS